MSNEQRTPEPPVVLTDWLAYEPPVPAPGCECCAHLAEAAAVGAPSVAADARVRIGRHPD